METRLWVRDMATLVVFIVAQMGIWRALRPWRRWVADTYGIIATAAILANLLSILWMLGIRFGPSYGTFLTVADAIGESIFSTGAGASVIDLACRFVGRRVPEKVSEERRQFLNAAGTIAVASPVAV